LCRHGKKCKQKGLFLDQSYFGLAHVINLGVFSAYPRNNDDFWLYLVFHDLRPVSIAENIAASQSFMVAVALFNFRLAVVLAGKIFSCPASYQVIISWRI
jgi:hypothetical protein